MVEIRKPVGRPEKTDSDGNRIVTKVINVNVPIKLIEFLKDEGINRSEMFTDVATSMFKKKICNICYTKLTETKIGRQCEECAHQYYIKTNGLIETFWKHFYNCPDCQEPYSHENTFSLTKQGLQGCLECQETKQQKLSDPFEDIMSDSFTPEKRDDL